MKRTIDNLRPSEAFRRLNPAIFGVSPCSDPVKAEKREEAHETRLRCCNKTETLFHEYLQRSLYAGQAVSIIVQPSRFFELVGGGTYTPDYMVFRHEQPGVVLVFEVKGGYRGPGWEQGYERYKRAALQWSGPVFRFAMAEFSRKKNSWKITEWR